MYDNWLANATVVAATLATVAACVLLHYEGLLFTSTNLERHPVHNRVKVLYAIFSVLLLHTAEIWLFGLVIWALLRWPECGSIAGDAASHLFDYVYLSAMTFSTVGFGDLAPRGPIRFLAGTEALTGFVLIAWSASFTYLEMQRFWRGGGKSGSDPDF
jgi:hypothetical protein